MVDIRIKDLPTGTPNATKRLAMDLTTTESATIKDVVYAGRPTASQSEAEAGVDADKAMTPVTTKQSIASQVGTTIASYAQGLLASTALQPADAAGFATASQGTKADNAVPNTRTVAGKPLSSDVTLAKVDVGLENVDNTSDVSKPVSTAQATADSLRLLKTANLSDLSNIAAARASLGLGTAATTDAVAYATAAQGALASGALQRIGGDVTGEVRFIGDAPFPVINSTTGNFAGLRVLNAAGRWDVGIDPEGKWGFFNYGPGGALENIPFVFGNDGVPFFNQRPYFGAFNPDGRLITFGEAQALVGGGGGGGGTVTSVFGRTGPLIDAQTGDYSFGQITGAAEALALLAPLASPALTGTPTAPTAAPGTNSTQIATMAAIQSAMGTLGNMAIQNKESVNIDGGSITGVSELQADLGTLGTIAGNQKTGVRQVANTGNSDVFETSITRFNAGSGWPGASWRQARTVDGAEIASIHYGLPFIGSDSDRGIGFFPSGNLAGFFRNDGTFQFQTRPNVLGNQIALMSDLPSGGALPFINADAYLVGDGSTDNTAAWASLQAAIPSQGALVIWPAKRYYFAGQITQTKPVYHLGVPNKVTPIGGTMDGSNGTTWGFGASGSFMMVRQGGGKFQGITFIKTTQGADLFTMPQATVSGQSGSSYVDFEGCLFYGPCTTAVVYITNALLLTFKSCRFNNTYKGGATKCVWLDGSQFGVVGNVRTGDNVDNIEFSECIATGFAKQSSSDFAQRIDGFYLDGKCDSTKFFQCKALWCFYGIILTKSGPTTQVPNFTRWAQGGFENNYKNAMYLQYGDITTFSDMYASLDSDVDSGSIYGNTDVVLQESTYIGASELTACLFRGAKRSGVRVEGGRMQINGGQIGNCGQRTTGYSVEVISTASKLIMQGVDCTTLSTGSPGGGQSSAIRNLKGASAVIINGCDLSGYSSAISGTATGAGISGNLL